MRARAKRALVPPTSPTNRVASLMLSPSRVLLAGSGVHGAIDQVRIGRAVVMAVGSDGRGEADAGAFLGRRHRLTEGAEQFTTITPGRAFGMGARALRRRACDQILDPHRG